ncbi:hypothetical protein AQUCO_00700648v1 [Aquilegia coerulea]|uniref:BAT2 N-terminal domain-containing protein n=1 Tax=Aquilegia coerulea TaxID=218851 RepID=A0A2G5EL17_AQUCA|nr:hypothetical protein AQUCO_00700648v1 [Aquilegia coerulea]
MANPGVGSKFVSVNLNKSYGQRSSSSGNSGGASRVRSSGGGNGVGGGIGVGGGGGGGGMVVLSRSRSSIVGVQKGGPKLSVPPPLNLPSLRKEHERFDSSSSGGGSAGAGNTGAGSRPTSSGIGWTKPAPLVLQENDTGNDQHLIERSGVGSPRVSGSDLSSYPSERASRGNNVYMPPSARSGMTGAPVAAPARDFPPVQRAVVLRGEDFPSLQATLPTTSGVAQKQKDNLNQKQNPKVSGQLDEQTGNSYLRPPFVTHPQNQSSLLIASDDKEGVNHRLGGSRNSEHVRNQDDFFPSPLPLVRLNHTSDWADDERDTGHGIPDRDRDQGYSRSDFLRDRDFDFPRISVPPRTSIHDHSEGRGLRHDDMGRLPSGGFLRGNTYNREVRSPSREGLDGSSWRTPSLLKDGFGGDRNGNAARPLGMHRENGIVNKYGQSHLRDSARDGYSSGFSGNPDPRFGRRDMGYGQGIRQTGNHMSESYSGRGAEQTKLDYYGSDLPSRHRGDSFQNGTLNKTSGKGMFTNDPNFNVSREKRLSSGKQFLEEPFLKDIGSGPDFDGRDPLTGTLVGVLKKKKDVLKEAEFYDPARESFEAELERVQKLQEQERQRVVEEHTRALELARKEEEERERVAREEEERRRRIEEEVREAAWRAEQERLEALRRAEEQKAAREEEKRRMQLEEERRKEAARKKLLELEARIARRQAEVTKDNESSSAFRDERMPGPLQEKDGQRQADVVDWEDGERMVERITNSASSDSSSLNRSYEMNSRSQFYKDGDSTFLDRGKLSNSWRRDVYENGNSSTIWQDQENGYRSPKRDAYGAGRAFPRKEFNGGLGTMPSKTFARGGIPESPMVDNFSHPRGNRWNLAGDGDPYSRNSDIDPVINDNFADKFSDVGWGLGRHRASHYASYPERLYQNSDSDGFSSFAKSRHSVRQPRVLPPPSLAAMNKNSLRSQIEPPSSSAFRDSEISYLHAQRKSEPILHAGYEASYHEVDQSRMVDFQKENTISQDQIGSKIATPRCESQSSLSVSSPPSSPTHLSQDDLEDSGDPSSLPAAAEDNDVHLSDIEHAGSVAEVSSNSKVAASSSITSVEDEEWDIENHGDLPDQEEYDEEDSCYREEDELHEGNDENVNLSQECEDLHLQENDPSRKKDQMVFGLNESIDVAVPNGDDLERSSGNEEKIAERQQVNVCVSDAGSLDGSVGIEQGIQSGNGSPLVSVESSKMTQEAEKTSVNFGDEHVSAVHSSVASSSYLLDSVEASSTSTLPPHQPLSSSGDMTLPSSTTQPIMSAVSAPTQSEVPINLQFGLFSGPSLIPSPVQAIQIGSIQMPLHLHHQVAPSLNQMHPPQPPFFQFGQLRYASPVSQGILPLGPQSMSFVQSSVPAPYSFNQNQNGSLKNQEGQDPRIINPSMRDKLADVSVDNQPGVQQLLIQPQHSSKEMNIMSVRQCAENEQNVSHSRPDSSVVERSMRAESNSHPDSGYRYFDTKKTYRSNFNMKESQTQLHVEPPTSQLISKAPGPMFSSRGKRLVYTVKNSGGRLSHPVSERPHTDFRGFQRRARPKLPRTEFRVRQNVDKRQTEASVSSNYPEAEKSSFNGRLSGTSVPKMSKQMVEAEGWNSDSSNALVVGSDSKMEKQLDREEVTSSDISHSREVNFERNTSFDEDVDAPLQSGIVRVYKQPGIEAPSDEDDFIEVRSKRQMLNDRREQREREIKAKSKMMKASRKRRSVSQNNVAHNISNKASTSLSRETANSSYPKSVISDSQSLERPTRYTNRIVSPPLAPIGTPSANTDAQADIRPYVTKSPQTRSIPVMSTSGSSLSYENKNLLLDSGPTSLSPWGNARMNQQVMALTQTQFDDAMKSARFEKHLASFGDRTSSVIEPNKLSSTIVTQDKSFSSVASPLNSLLAGEKIQFGAVTSPTILPPSSHVAPNGMGSCRSDVPIEHNLSALEDDCSLFFEKDKHLNESCVDHEDSEAEAEAEAAASAVAVAAISSDEIVGSGCSVSVSEAKSFVGAENEGSASESGGVSDRQSGSQSRGEESLSVALPADLSVETPSLSIWPSLPSPQHSSGQMLSHFPGGPPSHYPCYEMNPMLGGPIFAFGPHDETAGAQSQSHKNNASGSGSLGAWQQCHSGVDSFYGPPTGYTGPFIGPSGGIPGVQGPPHMVVYNHFTPVGQFGQVGLSFMGATYIPSGKQPDWKHNPASSAMGISEGDMNNLNIPPVHHNPHSMPPPIQHLAPGSPLLPMASPLTMFDMSPFQARWSHFSASPLHSAPLSMPLPQHAEGVLPSQFNHGSTIDQSTGNKFHESCSSATSDNSRNFSVETSATVSQFPDELGLMDTSSTTSARVSVSRPASYSSTIINGKAQSVGTKNLSRSAATSAGDYSSIHTNSSLSMSSSVKTHSAQQSQQYLHPTGYTDQRGVGVSQKVASGGEWSHRRMGFQGRNQSSGTDKKVKQIYVPKPATSQTSTPNTSG